jgi:cysteine desulfurase/selenocysteine lyase
MNAAGSFDVSAIREDFPILQQKVRGKPLIFLDTAASAQKPRVVLEAIQDFYANAYANIHRGVYQLSADATALYEEGRECVRDFIAAGDRREIVFVRNATEAINLVARTWGDANLGEGDEILITALEHHANIVPWQMLGQRRGSRLRVAPIDAYGNLRLDEFEALLGERTRLVALTHISNALGTINPLAEMIAMAKARGITVLVDGAQAVPHMAVDVAALGCDFYAFSGHKAFGPTGIGVLYGRLPLLEAMPPFLGGGDMIESVSFERTRYASAPGKFEAGTPDIAGVVGLAEALRYLAGIGLDAVAGWEAELLAYAHAALDGLEGVRLIGRPREQAAVISFVLDDIHAHDVGTALDQAGICVRVGHHCAQPLMDLFEVPATVRASFSIYNTHAEIDALIEAIQETRKIFC